jgi:DNA-binding NtrC family response regulator
MASTILIVDDDIHLTAGLQRILHKEPYRILTAASGEEALAFLGKSPCDIVVSDEQMPGMNGVELLTLIHQRWPRIVTMMLSGRATIGAIVRAVNQGQIFRFLIKPCDAEELAASLRQALAHKTLMDQCRKLLPMFRRQAHILSEVERRHPGITRSVETDIGTVIVKHDNFTSVDELSERIEVEIRHGEKLLGD